MVSKIFILQLFFYFKYIKIIILITDITLCFSRWVFEPWYVWPWKGPPWWINGKFLGRTARSDGAKTPGTGARTRGANGSATDQWGWPHSSNASTDQQSPYTTSRYLGLMDILNIYINNYMFLDPIKIYFLLCMDLNWTYQICGK